MKKTHNFTKNHQDFSECEKERTLEDVEGHSDSDVNGLASHHNAIAGPCGEVNVVRVAGYAAIPSLNVAGHVPSHRVDALTGAVGA